MQYILTQEEYNSLTSRNSLAEEKAKVDKLNKKVMELSGKHCIHEEHPVIYSYCDDCPIGSFGTNTCMKVKHYSK